jgi:6-phosphogluconolactonase
MFKRSGFSIAMGNASDEVKAQASVATDSYNDEGFAKAMERFILGSVRMNGRIETLADPAALARHVADWMTSAALAAKGAFRVSLSGGSTPRRSSRCSLPISSSDVSLARVSWYWGDERFVPYDHPESNYRMTREAMLAKAPVPPANIHPCRPTAPRRRRARYERTLQAAYGAAVLDPARPMFDITLLGLGPDGHTASLLPGEPVLEERKRWVAAVSHGRPEVRITMTYPVIESSRQVAFLVAGKEKAAIFKDDPCRRQRAAGGARQPVGELIWFVDRAAGEGETLIEVATCSRFSWPSVCRPISRDWARRSAPSTPPVPIGSMSM